MMRSESRTPRVPNRKQPMTSPRTLGGACRRADDISSAQNAAADCGSVSWTAASSAGRTREKEDMTAPNESAPTAKQEGAPRQRARVAAASDAQ
eukprot:9201617-Alexandrium_andersonii.AAC.1